MRPSDQKKIEAEVRRHCGDAAMLGNHEVFGKGTVATAEDPVSRREFADVGPDRLDNARVVNAEPGVGWRTDT